MPSLVNENPERDTGSRVPRALTLRWLLWNAPFVAALIGAGSLPVFVHPIIVGWTLLLGPGLAFTDRRRDAVNILASALIRSFVAAVSWWVILAALPGPTNQSAFILGLAVTMNAGLAYSQARSWNASSWPTTSLARVLIGLSVLVYSLTHVGAAHTVPALEDQDMEVQGTAYALIHDLRPAMVTNRGTTHFFAHPPLLHFWIGASMLITGDLDRVQYYRDAARGEHNSARARLDSVFATTFQRFLADPALLPTRTPNVILATLGVVALTILIHALTGSTTIAFWGGMAYATLPEVYVRSSYGGYMAGTNLLVLLLAAFLMRTGKDLERNRNHATVFALAVLAGLMDHKLVILVPAAILQSIISIVIARQQRTLDQTAFSRSVPALLVTTGFLAAWGAFVAYGLSIASNEFIGDHFRTHLLDRLQFDANYLLSTPAGTKYPSITALWMQFAHHTGPVIVILSLAGSVYVAMHAPRREWFLILFVFGGAVLFSVVDWRQTKHLAVLLPFMIVIASRFLSVLPAQWQTRLLAIAWLGIAWNAWRVVQLMRDFTYLVPYRMW